MQRSAFALALIASSAGAEVARLSAGPAALRRRATPASAPAACGALVVAARRLRGGDASFFGDLYDFSEEALKAAPAKATPRAAARVTPRSPSINLPAGVWFVLKSVSLLAVAASGVFVGRSSARARAAASVPPPRASRHVRFAGAACGLAFALARFRARGPAQPGPPP